MTKNTATTLIHKAGVLKLHSGISFVFYGLRIEKNNFYYYTARGIREVIVRQRGNYSYMGDERTLIASNHIASVPCENIAEIVSLNSRIAA